MSDTSHGVAARHGCAANALQLRVMRVDDIAAGLRLTRASHWNQLASDWKLFLTLSPQGCRVVVADNDEIVGSVATLRYGTAFSWIAMVLVDPAHRGQGVGTRLLEEALLVLDDVATVRLDATPEGYGVYCRAGFSTEHELQRMQRASLPLPAADHTAGTHVRRMSAADIEGVLRRDRDVFGADRQPLLQAFWREAPEYAHVSGDGGGNGYLFGRHGHTFEHLGPVVARDEETARQLVAACLSAHPHRPFIVDVPARASWIERLAAFQFTPQRPFIRMFRGTRPDGGQPDQVFGITGPEFG